MRIARVSRGIGLEIVGREDLERSAEWLQATLDGQRPPTGLATSLEQDVYVAEVTRWCQRTKRLHVDLPALGLEGTVGRVQLPRSWRIQLGQEPEGTVLRGRSIRVRALRWSGGQLQLGCAGDPPALDEKAQSPSKKVRAGRRRRSKRLELDGETPMSIRFEPGRVWCFDDLEPGTIALDGAVQGPQLDPEHRRYSFDHHGQCLRLVTTATCQQVLDALLVGLDPTGMRVLVNDLDGDTILAIWLLRHHRRWRNRTSLAKVRPLVWAVGGADAHGPAYPSQDPAKLDHFHSAILAHCRQAEGADLDAYEQLDRTLSALEEWWRQHLKTPAVTVASPPLPSIQKFSGWILAEYPAAVAGVRGRPASEALYKLGHDRIVTAVPIEGGRYRYLLAKRSDLVDRFPLQSLYSELTAAEQAKRTDSQDDSSHWGGGSSVGGGPRPEGSVLQPDEVAEILERVIQAEDGKTQ